MKWEVANGTYRYPHATRTVLQDVSFSLDAGEVLTVLGPNGAGKTTLLRCMTGLLPWKSGQTLLDGKPLSAVPRKELWRQVSYVPQARQTPVAYTVEEMVLLGRASSVGTFSLPGAADREAVERCLQKTNITDLRHRSCAELSGGEYQMVLIARALASEPQVLILDEPESNLDFKNQLLVLNRITELSADGITCIFNTHYPAHALRFGTKALMLARDGTYAFGNVRDVVTEDNIARYFGVRSVIGEVETADATYADVVPVALGGDASPPSADGRVIAAVTVLMEQNDHADAINALLHEYGDALIGRMGMPYREAGVHLITLTLDAPAARVRELADKLSRLPGTHVKSAYIAGDRNENETTKESD